MTLGHEAESKASESTGTRDGYPWRPLVLFDGACPICRREIAHYRRRCGADLVNWVDLSQQPTRESIDGVGWHEAMARFHVRDTRGCWRQGAEAFVELWSHLRGYRVAAWLVRKLGLLPLLERAYTGFARCRMARRCETTRCDNLPRFRRAGRVQP